MRITKDEYYLGIAKAVAQRSTCLRRQYGAVIVKNDRIISTGYNGSARGEPNCCDVGECWREAHNIPHGEQYEKCVVGDTRIKTLDGTNPKIKDVVGKELDVLAVDKSGNIVPTKAYNIRMTGVRNDICKITFDDGTQLACTQDHKIMMRDLSFKYAKDLRFGDSVMPYYGDNNYICNTWKENNFKPTKAEKELWSKTCKTKRTPIMYLVYCYYHPEFDKSIIQKNGEYLLHHQNWNHQDNTPNNLKIVTRTWHSEHHAVLKRIPAEERSKIAKKGVETQRILLENDSEFKAKKSKVGKANMTKLWSNDEWKERSIERCRENFDRGRQKSNKDPEAIKNRSKGKIRKGLSELLFCIGNENITESNYEELSKPFRKNGVTHNVIPSLYAILKYYESFDAAIIDAKTYNHKVVNIEFLNIPMPVYDLEVPDYHNFAVYLNESTGVFVHNCVAVHAEDNAISQAGRETIGATLYLAGFEDGKEIAAEPCMMCARKIKNTQIAKVITLKENSA